MTFAELLKTVADDDDMVVQLLNDCVARATMVKGKGDQPAHCKVTFGTQEVSVSDILNATGKVGIILWVPRERYNELLSK